MPSVDPETLAAAKMKYITAKEAAELDEALMSEEAGWSLDQLMELAGLSVACALQKLTSSCTCRVLIIVGPGNNGGDGLVAARHLKLAGYDTTVFYPKQKSQGIYPRLIKQLRALHVQIVSAGPFKIIGYEYIIDAIFGFSFSGDVRAPFDRVIQDLSSTNVPVLSVDVPSSWHIADGPPPADRTGSDFAPTALISLSAPKPCSRYFHGRHFLGGRFLDNEFMARYELPAYTGTDQIVELPQV